MTGDPLEGRIRAGLADAAADVEPTGTLAEVRARINRTEGPPMTLPALPARGEVITADEAAAIEAAVGSALPQITDRSVLEEWRDRAEALAAYLRDREARPYMLGTLRRIEARIGQLLGAVPRGQHTASSEHGQMTGLDDHQRRAFRAMGAALSGGTLAEHQWRDSRAAVYREIEAQSVPDPALAAQVRAGLINGARARRIARDRDAARAREQRDAAAAPPAIMCETRAGDFRSELAGLTGIHAVITDPPYNRSFVPHLADLATWADKALAPDGVLIVMYGQTWLNEAYPYLSAGRTYRWCGCWYTPGDAYVSHLRNVVSYWKPLLIYGQADSGRRVADFIRAGDEVLAAKDHHPWGQSYSAFKDLIERVTTPGETVADPMMGGGTVLAAARALGRHSIGCDIDPAAAEAARRRLQT